METILDITNFNTIHVVNFSSNVTPEADTEPEKTQSSETFREGSTKISDFEVASGIICILGELLYEQAKKDELLQTIWKETNRI